MDIKRSVRNTLILVVLLGFCAAFAACGGSATTQPSGTPAAGPSPEELQRQADKAELERLRAAERDRIAKEEADRKAAEEAKRQKEAAQLPPQFGQAVPPTAAATPPSETSRSPAAGATPRSAVAPLIASSAATATEAPTTPYDQAFPPIPDRLLRVAVVSAPSQANVAERIGAMLTETERARIENSLGMGLQIAYLSQADWDPKQRTRIQYREKYLQAAVRLAGIIPQAQKVERMPESEANRMGVDVMIQVGSDLN